MSRSLLVLVIGVMAFASACGADSPGAPPAADDEQINAVLDAYFEAVEQIDLEGFLELLAEPDEVSVITPAGRLHSRADLEGFFQGMRDGYAELHLERSNVTIRDEGSTAWSAYDFQLTGMFADGSPAEFSGWETQVYRRTAAGWRITHVHYSVPLVLPAAP
jgi:ketosteroid isomerase-like protein